MLCGALKWNENENNKKVKFLIKGETGTWNLKILSLFILNKKVHLRENIKGVAGFGKIYMKLPFQQKQGAILDNGEIGWSSKDGIYCLRQ